MPEKTEKYTPIADNRSSQSPCLTGAGGPLLNTCFVAPNMQPPMQPPMQPLMRPTPAADQLQHPPPYHGEDLTPRRPHPPTAPQFHGSPDSSTEAASSENNQSLMETFAHTVTEGNGSLMETFANTVSAILSHGASPVTPSTAPPPVTPLTPPSPVTSSTPVAARTRSHDDAPDILHLPMINVMGPQGPALIHRPWTDSDMIAAVAHLPDYTASGAKFAAALTSFCAEFKPTVPELWRLLLRKMGLTDYSNIRAACEGDQKLNHPEWEHGDNDAY